MKKFLFAAIGGLLFALSMPSNAIADDAFVCDTGLLCDTCPTGLAGLGPGDVPEDVDLIVPPGGGCILDSSLGDGIVTVDGDVIVSEDAAFVSLGAKVEGDVKADGAALVQFFQDLIFGQPGVPVHSVVEGHVKISGAIGMNDETEAIGFPTAYSLCGMIVDGDVKLKGIFGSKLIQVGDLSVCIASATIDGDLRISDNQTASPILVSNNVIDGDLICKRNVPPVSGVAGSNVVDGKVKGECAVLVASTGDDDDDSDDDSDSDSDDD